MSIFNAVSRVLTEDRLVDVASLATVNDDGAPILRVRVFYSQGETLSVDEMERVVDAIWSIQGSDVRPFPVVDFIESEDCGRVTAAE